MVEYREFYGICFMSIMVVGIYIYGKKGVIKLVGLVSRYCFLLFVVCYLVFNFFFGSYV